MALLKKTKNSLPTNEFNTSVVSLLENPWRVCEKRLHVVLLKASISPLTCCGLTFLEPLNTTTTGTEKLPKRTQKNYKDRERRAHSSLFLSQHACRPDRQICRDELVCLGQACVYVDTVCIVFAQGRGQPDHQAISTSPRSLSLYR